jgi:cell division septum initiation protein DivIVA
MLALQAMQARAWLFGCCLLLGWLIFQSWQIERLETRLERYTHAGEGVGDAQHPSAKAASTKTDARLASLDERLAVIDDRVAALEDGAPARSANAVVAAANSAEARSILTVVEREQRRVLDKQLRYHRERLIEQRQASLDDFSTRFGLTPVQTQRIHRLLLDETDEIFRVLGSQETSEDPDRAGRDLRAWLEETDRKAGLLLNPVQQQAWAEARAIERNTIMPWIPKY